MIKNSLQNATQTFLVINHNEYVQFKKSLNETKLKFHLINSKKLENLLN